MYSTGVGIPKAATKLIQDELPPQLPSHPKTVFSFLSPLSKPTIPAPESSAECQVKTELE